jgi:hypothetical protein
MIAGTILNLLPKITALKCLHTVSKQKFRRGILISGIFTQIWPTENEKCSHKLNKREVPVFEQMETPCTVYCRGRATCFLSLRNTSQFNLMSLTVGLFEEPQWPLFISLIFARLPFRPTHTVRILMISIY